MPTDADSSPSTSGGGSPYECDPWAQDCPPGQKCMPWSTRGESELDATRCVPVVPNPAGIGEPCSVEENPYSGIDDCDEGAVCWYVDASTLEGECVPLCGGSEANQECPDGRVCPIMAVNNGVPPYCLLTCDPIARDCGLGRGCYAVLNTFVCLPDESGRGGEYGMPCSRPHDCSPGLLCAQAGQVPDCASTSRCCTELCDLTEPHVCAGEAGGQACVPMWQPGTAPEGLEHVGVCVAPS
jgi:hypothetical protein